MVKHVSGACSRINTLRNMNNLKTIISPYNGQAVRPIIRQKTIGNFLITEAHYICPNSGQFITKVEISREEKKTTPQDQQLVQEMVYEDIDGTTTKDFFTKINNIVNLLTQRFKGVPDEIYTIDSVIKNGMKTMKNVVDLPSDDTAYNKTYKPIRVNLPIPIPSFRIGKDGPRESLLPSLENLKALLMDALSQITTRDSEGGLEPTKVVYTEQTKLLFRIIDLVEDVIDQLQ